MPPLSICAQTTPGGDGQRAIASDALYQLSDGGMPFKYHPVRAIGTSIVSLMPKKLAFVMFSAAMLTCWIRTDA
ncbi:hypothetical protein GGD66_008024 [Bradyrhizobium sp. CIR48]|uniref:hypothetical protein n=1 Tax=Bradyrhizobium sp. CIR48 TaxID=2663840 RepID=UPI00160691AA|nr:hypothetical protein [Bradyrhizobium sp. CIR48]MBB4429422.1 hypothetical protein [Bradyrhizobium sp. CIR48]